MEGLLRAISGVHFTWLDAIDILIVSYLIYRIFLLVKGTLATRILIGVSILYVALKLSEFIGLKTIHWILLQFWLAWVLVMVIVFQPEVRRALAEMGMRPIFTRKSHYIEEKMIDQIVEAVATLSKNKWGAIIAIERKIGLRPYKEIGTSLNADVSTSLLLSIFNPFSPLHDGGVIISNNKIASATSFFPLTKNPVDKEFGTRHRAAIGLSEETDAIAIVVSEETGAISCVENGNLIGPLKPEALKELIHQVLIPEARKKSRKFSLKKIIVQKEK